MASKDASLAPVPPSAIMIRLSPLAGLFMLLFLAAGLGFCLWAIASGKVELLPKKPSWAAFTQGDFTRQIADQLDAVPMAQRAADLERAVSWLAIGDTGPRVRQGCSGWLFLAAEFTPHAQAEANARARAEKVKAVQGWLAKRNIQLLVVVVPDKSRIAAQQLCGLQRAEQLHDRVTRWQVALLDQQVAVLDLSAALLRLGSDAFLRTDTHWSEQGAEAAAQAIAAAVSRSAVTPKPPKLLQRSADEAAVRPGDLVRLAGLDWLPQNLQPSSESVAASRFTTLDGPGEASSEDDLFGDSQLPNIALIGTSFAGNSNFVAFLEQALGASIGNFAKDGGEFSGAAKDYFGNAAFTQTPPQLLIWEIPERDLQAPYNDDLPLAP